MGKVEDGGSSRKVNQKGVMYSDAVDLELTQRAKQAKQTTQADAKLTSLETPTHKRV